MKIAEIRKLRQLILSRRCRLFKDWQKETPAHSNLYAPRLLGKVEALDGALDDIDHLLSKHRAADETLQALLKKARQEGYEQGYQDGYTPARILVPDPSIPQPGEIQ